MQGFNIVIITAIGLGKGFCSTEEGPYEAIVSNVTSCVAKQPSWYHTNITTYTSNGRTFLRGTFYTKQAFKDPKFNIQLNYIDQDMQVKAFEFKSQNCRNMIFRIVMKTIGLQKDDQMKCLLKPTSVEFSNIDVNAILHIMVHSLWYGSVRIHIEILKSTTLLMCLDINVRIRKAD